MKYFLALLKLFICLSFVLFWVSTGNAQFYKVSMVKDINPGPGSSNPENLTFCNDKLYFAANNGTSGTELWKSDGTSAGTTLVSDINSGAASSTPKFLTAINFTLFFAADDGVRGAELWRHQTAGAGAGTYLVKDICPFGSVSSEPSGLINLNGTLVLAANDGINNKDLWKSNGSAAGTILVDNLLPWPSGGNYNDPIFTKVGNKVYFNAYKNLKHYLFSYDLSNVYVQDMTGEGHAENIAAEEMINVNGTLFLSALGWTSKTGKELYKKDGIHTELHLVKDIFTGEDVSSNPKNLIKFDGNLYFSATTGIGNSLWKSDGTSAGTVIVKANVGSGNFENFCTVSGTLYFTISSTDNGNELWKSDGTAAGTVLVKDILPGAGNSSPANLFNFKGALYFTADDGIHGRELWRSNGTEEGTFMVDDLNIGSESSNPSGFADVDNELFFAANNGVNGIELWKVKRCPDMALATSVNTSITQNVINANFFNGENCNNLITTIKPTGGATSINGNVTARVWNQSIQPVDYVKRHYQITPANYAATATARVTLYFTDADFNAFNTQTPGPSRLLPVSYNPVLIAAGKANLRIEKRGGSSSNGTGMPVTYPGTVETIDPDDEDIVWDSGNSWWEVSFNVTSGFSGFFVKTRTNAIPSTYTFTGTGNWNLPSNWQYGAMPPASLSPGSEIIINPSTGSCILNIPYTVPKGVKLIVSTAKLFQINGNLTINVLPPS